jgi:four helix bundle protein
MTPKELIARIERFADAVIALCRAIPHDPLTIRLLTQLQDAATSTAANYRAACRAGSKAAFVSKLSIALEEADEAAGWLQRLANISRQSRRSVDCCRKQTRSARSSTPRGKRPPAAAGVRVDAIDRDSPSG